MIYQIRNLVRSTNVREAKVESEIPKSIHRVIEDELIYIRGMVKR